MNDILKTFIEATVSIAAPVIAAIVVALAIKLFNWVGLKEAAQALDNNKQVTINAIAYAENEAAKKLKESNTVMPGAEKLDTAITHMILQNPKITKEAAAQWVESVLPQLGKGAIASVKQSLEALPNK